MKPLLLRMVLLDVGSTWCLNDDWDLAKSGDVSFFQEIWQVVVPYKLLQSVFFNPLFHVGFVSLAELIDSWSLGRQELFVNVVEHLIFVKKDIPFWKVFEDLLSKLVSRRFLSIFLDDLVKQQFRKSFIIKNLFCCKIRRKSSDYWPFIALSAILRKMFFSTISEVIV